MIAMVKVFTAIMLFIPTAFAGTLVPRRDTPNFHLMAVTTDPNYHLKPLRINANVPSLAAGNPAIFYLEAGRLRLDNGGPNVFQYAVVDSVQGPGSCNTNGQLLFLYNTPNTCAQFTTFGLASYDQNSQLGAKSVLNWVNDYHVCSDGSVYYGATSPSGCTQITLWTVPAV